MTTDESIQRFTIAFDDYMRDRMRQDETLILLDDVDPDVADAMLSDARDAWMRARAKIIEGFAAR